MQEEIFDFNEMVTNFYRNFGKDNMIVTFLYINILYTYIDLNSRLLDVDSIGNPIYNNGKRTRKELITIPVILEKKNFEKLFNDDNSKIFNIDDIIDVGTSYNFNYEKIYKNISRVIPKECHIINNEEIRTIASISDYENIFFDTVDESNDFFKEYNLEPVLKTRVYGVKKLEIGEKTK